MATLRRRVLTEKEVRQAAKAGQRSLDPAGAIVTPAARDAASALGVSLEVRLSPVVPSPPSALTGPAAIVVGADHGGVALKDTLVAHLRTAGHEVSDVGTFGTAAVDYPDFAAAVAHAVASGQARFGIMIDGAGIGSCMAANKIPGARAAACHDVTTAANAREHNNANVLTLGAGLLGTRLALDVVDTFLRTPFGGGRHQARVDKVDALDRRR
ncbi:MAG: ribose 5-phosphate isomerase B [Gemmatimonadetes bacterium]|nr:ribose 5-phosphate isomerase B [Gemmatimonadota bacterium]